MSFPDRTEYSRLRASLNDSKMHITNSPLYQTINGLITAAENFGEFSKTSFANPNSVGGFGDLITLINNLTIIVNKSVQGPVSSIDNDIAVFDGVTGKKIKDSGINISAITAGSGFAHTFMLMGG